jgi:hypothetical protein
MGWAPPQQVLQLRSWHKMRANCMPAGANIIAIHAADLVHAAAQTWCL